MSTHGRDIPVHFACSHAHEEIPGTVDMNASEGEDTAFGLALYPVPAKDPNDPLLWSKSKKLTILFLTSVYSWVSNGALLGASVYTNYLSQRFRKTPDEVSHLITYPNLLFGLGSLIFVPLYYKIGRRPTMMISLIIHIVGLIGCATVDSFGALLAFRCIHGFGSCICEALPAQVVSDIFFLHERGRALGLYTLALTTGSVHAVWAGYMVSGSYSFHLFFWVETAFALAILIGTFFFFEETMYFRPAPAPDRSAFDAQKAVKETKEHVEAASEIEVPARKTYWQQLKLVETIDYDAPFFLMAIRSFTYYFVPPVFWVCSTYGMVIGLAGLVFTTTFPGIIAAPPYNWYFGNTGLIAIAGLLGYFAAALPLGGIPDRYSADLSRRNGGIREAEFRLWILIPFALFSPAALVLYGYAAQRHLHWVSYFFAVGLFQFGSFFYLTYTLAYALESYPSNVPEMLISMNVGKQSISFAFGFKALQWVQELGYVKVVAGIFCGAQLINNLVTIGFLTWGKKMRVWLSKTWLAKMHRESICEVS